MTHCAPWHELPLVGRTDDVARLLSALASDRLHVLTGPPGIGKTRVSQALLKAASDEGWCTRSVCPTGASGGVPYAALLPLLQQSAPARAEEVATALRRQLTPQSGDSRPRLLVIDDAYLLDRPSVELVASLTRAGLVALLVVRSAEAGPLGPPAPDLLAAHAAVTHHLGPLSTVAVRQLLHSMLGGVVDGSTAHAVWRVTSGNPLWCRQLASEARSADVLVHVDGAWTFKAEPRPPDTLQASLLQSLAALPADQQDIVHLLALTEPLELALAERIVDLNQLMALEDRGLLRVQQDGSRQLLYLPHPLFGEVMAGRAPTLRCRAKATELAGQLADTGMRRPLDASRFCSLWLAAGRPSPVPVGPLVAAAASALAAADVARALRLAEAVPAAQRDVSATLVLANALIANGRPEDAETLLADANETHPGDPALAVTRGMNLVLGLDDPEGLHVLASASDRVAEEAHPRLLATSALLQGYAGYISDSETTANQVIAVSGPGSPEHAAAIAALATVDFHRARPGLAAAKIAPVVEQMPTDPAIGDARLVLLTGYSCNLVYRGPISDGLAVAERIYHTSVAAGWRDGMTGGAWAATVALLVAGRPRAALQWLDEALALMRGRDPFLFLPAGLSFRGLALALLGQVSDARRELSRGAALMPRLNVFANDWHRECAIWVEAAAGRRAHSLTLARTLAEEARQTRPMTEIRALHALARLGAARDVQGRLATLAATSDSPLIDAYAGHTTALACGDAKALVAAGHRLAGLDAHLVAAESFACAARAAVDSLQHRLAAEARQGYSHQIDRCDGACHPWVPSPGGPARLTDRQREVCLLAASGASNAAIAQELSLSVRTVENHLQNAYSKLGIGGREDLRSHL